MEDADNYIVRLDEYGRDRGVVHGPTDRDSAIETADRLAREAASDSRVDAQEFKPTPSDAYSYEGYAKHSVRSWRVQKVDD